MSFNIDPLWLFLSLVPSAIGFVVFTYGRKEQRWPQFWAGLLLMVYPYFTPTATSMVVVGAVIGAGLWWAIRLGW